MAHFQCKLVLEDWNQLLSIDFPNHLIFCNCLGVGIVAEVSFETISCGKHVSRGYDRKLSVIKSDITAVLLDGGIVKLPPRQ